MSEEPVKKLRFAAIGVGANVYNMHRPALQQDFVEVVGVCDIRTEVGEKMAAEWGCPHYPDLTTMIADSKPDVVSVLPPHPTHAPMSIEAMEAGCHVLVEKPMAVEVAEADAMIETQKRTGKVLAVNFQQRLRPEIIAAKKLIDDGVLGKIQNADMKMSWTRTGLYYTQVDWRGTWDGEGGGVLMNQAPHELDLLCHFLGMPARVSAWTRTIVHKIDTEDTIQAIIEWPEGALGSVHISTAEAGQEQRFELIGTRGHLSISKGNLDLKLFDTPVDDYIATADVAFGAPNLHDETVEIGEGSGDHPAVYRNLYSALVHGTPLNADGPTGIRGLELANAMNYSSYTKQTVEFPLNREAYSQLLADLRAGKR